MPYYTLVPEPIRVFEAIQYLGPTEPVHNIHPKRAGVTPLLPSDMSLTFPYPKGIQLDDHGNPYCIDMLGREHPVKLGDYLIPEPGHESGPNKWQRCRRVAAEVFEAKYCETHLPKYASR